MGRNDKRKDEEQSDIVEAGGEVPTTFDTTVNAVTAVFVDEPAKPMRLLYEGELAAGMFYVLIGDGVRELVHAQRGRVTRELSPEVAAKLLAAEKGFTVAS